MRQTLKVVTCSACFALLIGCSEEGSTPKNADSVPSESTTKTVTQPPSQVLTKFYLSLADSNNDDAISCTIGDQLSREFVDSQVRLNNAFQLLGTNSVKCFGDDGKKLQMPPPAIKALEKIEQVAVIVSGPTATWPLNRANPMKLVLMNGQWKLDLANSFPSSEVLRSSIETFDAISVYISDVANEVASGKYKTVSEVQQEIKRRGQGER